jgi:hypothetical protein
MKITVIHNVSHNVHYIQWTNDHSRIALITPDNFHPHNAVGSIGSLTQPEESNELDVFSPGPMPFHLQNHEDKIPRQIHNNTAVLFPQPSTSTSKANNNNKTETYSQYKHNENGQRQKQFRPFKFLKHKLF